MNVDKSKFSHIRGDNNPAMVDISSKTETLREATARSIVIVSEEVMELFNNGEIYSTKGPVFQTAIIAGTMAVKRTGDLIPLCHPLSVSGCSLSIEIDGHNSVVIECTVRVNHRTGVEMEALVGASIAALTVYDMCKSVTQEIKIGEIKMLRKSGGKRDFNVSSL